MKQALTSKHQSATVSKCHYSCLGLFTCWHSDIVSMGQQTENHIWLEIMLFGMLFECILMTPSILFYCYCYSTSQNLGWWIAESLNDCRFTSAKTARTFSSHTGKGQHVWFLNVWYQTIQHTQALSLKHFLGLSKPLHRGRKTPGLCFELEITWSPHGVCYGSVVCVCVHLHFHIKVKLGIRNIWQLAVCRVRFPKCFSHVGTLERS